MLYAAFLDTQKVNKIYKTEIEAHEELNQLPEGIDVDLDKITSFQKFK